MARESETIAANQSASAPDAAPSGDRLDRATAGPWKVNDGTSPKSLTVRSFDEKPVAEVWFNGDDPEANARLIASAPDLAARVKALEEERDGWKVAWEALRDQLTLRAELAEQDNARLRGALRPFAAEAEGWTDETPDWAQYSPDFTVGDFRRARTALGGSHVG